MIVVDTNTIAYLLLSNPPNNHSQDIDQLVERETDWIAPYLWRSEFRNILATYVRKQLLDIQSAVEIQLQAERILLQNEYQVDSKQVLMLAADSGCSAYDCEFVALAKSLKIPLITADKKILSTFPDIALTAKDYLAR